MLRETKFTPPAEITVPTNNYSLCSFIVERILFSSQNSSYSRHFITYFQSASSLQLPSISSWTLQGQTFPQRWQTCGHTSPSCWRAKQWEYYILNNVRQKQEKNMYDLCTENIANCTHSRQKPQKNPQWRALTWGWWLCPEQWRSYCHLLQYLSGLWRCRARTNLRDPSSLQRTMSLRTVRRKST